MIGDSATLLQEIVQAFEARLVGTAGGGQCPYPLVTLDRIDIPKALPSTLLHLGYGVDIPAGSNTGQYRDASISRWEEKVRVVLVHRMNPQQQRTSRDAAYLLEDQIVAWLTDPRWMGDLHIRCADATRAPHAQSSEWFLITLTFSCTRDRRLGG